MLHHDDGRVSQGVGAGTQWRLSTWDDDLGGFHKVSVRAHHEGSQHGIFGCIGGRQSTPASEKTSTTSCQQHGVLTFAVGGDQCAYNWRGTSEQLFEYLQRGETRVLQKEEGKETVTPLKTQLERWLRDEESQRMTWTWLNECSSCQSEDE